jgi:predicted nuclease of predicted toxin-antitoxin system
VRVLLDEQLPRLLRRQFPSHFVQTVRQQGWTGLRNGDLLRRANAAGFDVFITADQSLQFQQNLAGMPLIVIVLVAASTKLEDLLPLAPSAVDAIRDARPGEVRRVGGA